MDVIHVVAGVVIDADGRILIAQRPAGKHLAGGWEFPGGKLEPGESRRTGLARELKEEIGIEIGQPRPLLRLQHAYPTRTVLLDVWVVKDYRGRPQSLDGQQLRWCTQDELATADLLPADRPIVAALRLPERLTERISEFYEVAIPGPASAREAGSSAGARLFGAYCASAAQVLAAARADFVVLGCAVTADILERLCRTVDLPVYATGLTLAEAWALGASGVNEVTL